MASLKELRSRIASVKATQKITSAMKMVAAAKLRRAQEQAEAARPYAQRMERMLASLGGAASGGDVSPLLAGTGSDQVHLVVVATADRGLCGGFNTGIARRARRLIDQLVSEGKTVKILAVGRKGRDQLRRTHRALIGDTIEGIGRRQVAFAEADELGKRLLAMFEAGEFDVATIVYAEFKSAIANIVTVQQLIPAPLPPAKEDEPVAGGAPALYEFEPSQEEILSELLPRNLSVQIYRALLENSASEHGARMSAMDNATRNAGDMIKGLTLSYNRTRQAMITKELIEIISGAEAL
ncbi:F-type H+-transporting ATPase subunit gamma [Constrictibacter sp. MBR-5]|jgi:F-type H+-transporting ATPase subunit gamma|uniref:F0F1 ATP synthase subunit gamma n=1 Tax=Constrictibacter sp. MBR-5 TaxID=3156467 RepID=UPI003395A740